MSDSSWFLIKIIGNWAMSIQGKILKDFVLKWIEIDLSRNKIDNIVFGDINENLKSLDGEC